MQNYVIVRRLGLVDYSTTFRAMHEFTLHRDPQTVDEIWFLEHPPIFTQGRAGKSEHVLYKSDIPIFQSDRGGQITFHAPGQQIVYFLIDLKRHHFGIRDFVSLMEKIVICTLKYYHIDSYSKNEAPGIYVNEKKICSLGLKISKGCTLHGLALNVTMDLEPFKQINPCGFSGLEMTQLSELTKKSICLKEIQKLILNEFLSEILLKPIFEEKLWQKT